MADGTEPYRTRSHKTENGVDENKDSTTGSMNSDTGFAFTPPKPGVFTRPESLFVLIAAPVAILALTPIVLSPVAAAGLDLTSDAGMFFGLLAVAGAIAATVALFLYTKIKNSGVSFDWKHFLHLDTFSWRRLGIGVGSGLGYFLILQAVAFTFALLTGHTFGSSNTSNSMMNASGVWFILIGFVVVPFITPFFEELFFRGFLLSVLRSAFTSKSGTVLSVLVTALMFSLFHIQGFSEWRDLLPVASSFVMGLICGTLVVKTKSLWTSVACHGSFNLVSSAVMVYVMASS